TDPNNCGACNNKCGPGAACTSGVCSCAGAQIHCGANAGCIDTTTDPAHCGACGGPGTVGGQGQICVSGQCTCAVAGQTNCGACNCAAKQGGNVRAAPPIDAFDCGLCGSARAGANSKFCAGRAACSCKPGFTSCAISGQQVCLDLMNNFTNCGACGNNCGNKG